ncbi:competence/damage-inducible protein A [Sphingobacterium sp. SGG-5]|uniref:competence/damage-inducible protein A n=1 Tax=Sphingobacterium sp. SGG-5 TaxID=2710881 RepID=UPI0013EB9CBF|nr:competence/damage-inducible protein A [Sphingobacterium sp. SGG-5]NGM62774.1 competence/damage-inducible protein A [Sphingobacterium sp. SGG-5]
MGAEIITIGDEILLGQIVDTNSAWIAEQLTPLDIQVVQITSIPDEAQAIITALDQAAKRSKLVIVTGGLGPTKDDVTKKTIAQYFDTELHLDPEVLAHVKALFARHAPQREVPLSNYAQAEVLARCEVLFNDVGTAPGMWVEDQGVRYIFLPGVPFEMKFLMEHRVLPRLAQLRNGEHTYHAYLLTVGLGESYLAEKIADIENALPATIKLAYLPKIGLIRLRLSAKGTDAERLKEETDSYTRQIADRLRPYIVSHQDISFEQAIVEEFTRQGLKIATAESCTGGAIAACITQIAGASQVFDCGIVAYHNKIKSEVLGVNESTLTEFGAVSEQTVRQMAEGVKQLSGGDYGIATSGIAGPSGGSAEKPVGTVWIAVAGKGETIAKKFQFANSRAINIERSRMQALIMLWMLYKKEFNFVI